MKINNDARRKYESDVSPADKSIMAAKELVDNSSIDYSALENVKSHELQKDLTQKLAQKGLGRADSLRRVVLTYVVAARYEDAKKQIQNYFDAKADYPRFQNRCRRHLDHCKDLVNAIESKRNFPGLAHMALAKRQELFDRVIQHFDELRTYLRQMEMIDKETKILDLRSTTWVLKTVMNSVFLIFTVAFLIDYFGQMEQNFLIVFDQMVTDLVKFALKIWPS